jgi:4-oxalocrotonate tautomerase
MPIVSISVWQGFGEDRARQVIKGITDSFVQVGVPAQAVEVVIHEVPRSHWGVGGQVSTERPRQSSDAPPPRQTDRPRRADSAARTQGASRQDRPARPGRPSRPDTRPGSRPRRGGSGQR